MMAYAKCQGLLPDDDCLSEIHAEFHYFERQSLLLVVRKSVHPMYLEHGGSCCLLDLDAPVALEAFDKVHFLDKKYIFRLLGKKEKPPASHKENEIEFMRSSPSIWKSPSDLCQVVFAALTSYIC
jgi:hypothetical protein